jgi:hypothetical protein
MFFFLKILDPGKDEIKENAKKHRSPLQASHKGKTLVGRVY